MCVASKIISEVLGGDRGTIVVMSLNQPSISTAHQMGIHVLDHFFKVVLP